MNKIQLLSYLAAVITHNCQNKANPTLSALDKADSIALRCHILFLSVLWTKKWVAQQMHFKDCQSMIDTCIVYRHLDTNHLHKHCAAHNIILHPSLSMPIYWIMQIDSKIFIFCLSSHMTNDKEQQWSSKCKHLSHLWNMIMSESRGETYFPKGCDNGNRERCSLIVWRWHRDNVYRYPDIIISVVFKYWRDHSRCSVQHQCKVYLCWTSGKSYAKKVIARPIDMALK